MEIKWGVIYATPNMLQLVERCGRVCYRSEERITEDSAVKMIRNLGRSGHRSVFEHSNVIIGINFADNERADLSTQLLDVRSINPFIEVFPTKNTMFLRCNIRALVDFYNAIPPLSVVGGYEGIFKIILQASRFLPQEFFEGEAAKRLGVLRSKNDKTFDDMAHAYPNGVNKISDDVTVLNIDRTEWTNVYPMEFVEQLMTATLLIDMSRQTSHQFVRHRVASYSQESQRYVDLCERFEYIHPDEIGRDEKFEVYLGGEVGSASLTYDQMMQIENNFYKALRKAGYKPEVSRGVLPNDAKTEIAVTKTIEQWRKYFMLRLEAHAQRNIRKLSASMLKGIQQGGYLLDLQLDEENFVLK